MSSDPFKLYACYQCFWKASKILFQPTCALCRRAGFGMCAFSANGMGLLCACVDRFHSVKCAFRFENGAADYLYDLGNDRVAKRSKSVHPCGNPIKLSPIAGVGMIPRHRQYWTQFIEPSTPFFEVFLKKPRRVFLIFGNNESAQFVFVRVGNNKNSVAAVFGVEATSWKYKRLAGVALILQAR